ncbi:hypothetical protein V9T40_002621 [Parthenolecanium corni]|uniref:Uncharacterized protein n=1 Tax=Parthenolecanium corni TaxID=536013 RepID=A0AAN9TL36_9HEMI
MENTRRYAESRNTYQTEQRQSAAEDTVSYLRSEEQITRTKSQVLFSSDAYFEPCSLFSTVISPSQTSKFSFTAGLNACRELCAMKYECNKFGVCIPVVGCRCLTKGFTNILQWFKDVTIDPKKTAEEKICDT